MVDGSSEKLTDSQKKLLAFIEGRYEAVGIAPSYREIQEHFKYRAIGTVQDHVKALIKKGFLEPANGKSRTLIPKNQRREGTKSIPIFGEIAAGPTRDNPELNLGKLHIAESLVSGPSFALRVVGDSMIEAGILEGDCVIVEKKASIRNGDIVVALVNGETTVKRFRKEKDGVYLIPENRKLKPMKITTERFEIQGKVVGLQREYN